MPLLLDVNVWLPLNWDGHAAHPAATAWASAVTDDLLFCRVTQLALLRHMTNPAIMGPDVLKNSEAATVIDALLAQDAVHLQDEPAGLSAIFPDIGKARTPSRNLWTDAYLAAFAIASNIQFVTFDKGFSRFERHGLKWQLLRW